MKTTKELVLLTREGCANTDIMRAHLDGALRSLNQPPNYRVIDIGTLPVADARGGYGTPTILYDGKDLFGLPEPAAPHGPPT